MKNLFFLGLCTLLINSVWAQESFEVTHRQKLYNPDVTEFSLDLIGVNETDVLAEWILFTKDNHGKSRLVEEGEGDVELETELDEFPILQKPVTAHILMEPNPAESGVVFTIWLETDNGHFFSSEKDEKAAEQISDWLLSFGQKLQEHPRQ